VGIAFLCSGWLRRGTKRGGRMESEALSLVDLHQTGRRTKQHG